jgi:hypothetical protein
MNKDEVWERLKRDDSKVYGQGMLDMFLKTTNYLERRHWEELDQGQRKLVSPEVRLRLASTVQEAERAAKEGARDFDWALHNAALGGHLEVCEWLVGKGAREFEWALSKAALGGHLEICEWLAGKGARDFDGALYNAARGGHLEICEWLAGRGARDFVGALYGAASGGHLEICEWATGKGARNFEVALSYARGPAVRDYLMKAGEQHGQA